MKSALMAVAITALMGGLVVAPVTQQSAQALVPGGLKALGSTGGTPTSGTTNDRGEVILVGRGGGGGGGGGAAACTIFLQAKPSLSTSAPVRP